LKQIILNLSRERDENARQCDERTRERDDWHVKSCASKRNCFV
jgi:hypothetical protein